MNLPQGKDISKFHWILSKKSILEDFAIEGSEGFHEMHLQMWIMCLYLDYFGFLCTWDRQTSWFQGLRARLRELRQEKFNENLRKRRKSNFDRTVLLLSKEKKANDDWFLCQIGSFCVDRLVARGLRGHIVELCRRLLYHWYPTSLLSQLGRANWDWKNIGSR